MKYVLTAYGPDGSVLRKRTAVGKKDARITMSMMIGTVSRFGGYVKAEPDPYVTTPRKPKEVKA